MNRLKRYRALKTKVSMNLSFEIEADTLTNCSEHSILLKWHDSVKIKCLNHIKASLKQSWTRTWLRPCLGCYLPVGFTLLHELTSIYSEKIILIPWYTYSNVLSHGCCFEVVQPLFCHLTKITSQSSIICPTIRPPTPITCSGSITALFLAWFLHHNP